MYLDEMAAIDRKNTLSEGAGTIDALKAAVGRDRRTIAGRFTQWLHFHCRPEEYTVLVTVPTRSGKEVGTIILRLLGWHGHVQAHDRKADPDTLH